MAEYGIKISKPGVDVNTPMTDTNKKDFQLISTDGALIINTVSTTKDNTKKFLGYKLTDTNTKAHPLNYPSGTTKYVISVESI